MTGTLQVQPWRHPIKKSPAANCKPVPWIFDIRNSSHLQKNEEKKRFFEVGTYRRVHSYHIWLQSLCQHANDQSSSCFCMTALAYSKGSDHIMCSETLFDVKISVATRATNKIQKKKSKENQDSLDFCLQYAHLQA